MEIQEMNKKKRILFTLIIKDEEISVSAKSFIEWIILISFVLLIPIGIYSNLFAFEYRYFKCENNWPLELRGSYYRLPGDEGYGVHSDSNYSYCVTEVPQGVTRDPSTSKGAKIVSTQLARDTASKDFSLKGLGFNLYVPSTYAMSPIGDTHDPSNANQKISYTVTTNDGLTFMASVMKKDSDFSYTNLCSKPAEENWSGQIIGKDKKGRDICKTNLSKYLNDYIVGINIGETAIMLQTKLGTVSEEVLNTNVINIFSSMDLYSKSFKGPNYTQVKKVTDNKNQNVVEKQTPILDNKPFSKTAVN